ncbi:MAG: hypothetical protein JO114_21595, partial [Planctomycetaceae bacterium]|nr:hypothetical protein [Planctomycetaceae bacterium]
KHHAEAALQIETALERLSTPETAWIVRRIYPYLPSWNEEFRRSEPLTRICDIAHRNNIAIDHYKLLGLVAFTGRTIPLCCENIFAPLLPRPGSAAEIDALARIAREYLELVIRGLQSMQPRL